jgi:hypothetical protein
MKEYAEDTAAFVTLKKAWQVKPGVGPERQTWYDRYVVHPMQKIVDGDRAGADATAKALLHIGKRNGNDYLRIVKDNFVLSDLFPDVASGIDRGTWTRTTGRAANAALKGARGQFLGAGQEVVGAAADASTAVRRNMLRKILEGQKGFASSMEEFVSGVKDVAEKAKAPLIDFGQKVGQVGSTGERVLHAGAVGLPPFVGGRSGLREPGQIKQPQATARSVTPDEPSAPYPSPARMGKYSGVLKLAQERGETALGATHYILSQRDPEYRKQFKSSSEASER